MSQPAPTIIGARTFPLNQCPQWGCRIGPYEHSTDLWYLIAENPDQTTGPNLVAYKSTDSGATYTRIVAGPSLAIQPGSNLSNGFGYVTYKGTGTALSIGYLEAGGELQIIAFDMATELFGVANGTGISPTNLRNLSHCILGSGAPVLIYSQFSLHLFAVVFSAGVWQTPVKIDDNSAVNWYHENAVVDGSGNIGILYSRGSDPSTRTGQKLYAIFNGTTVLSRTSTPLVAFDDTGIFCAPLYESHADAVVFPLVRSVVVGITHLPEVALLVGTPSATPVFTVKVVKLYSLTEVAFTGGDVIDFANVVVNSAGNHFTMHWFYVNPTSRDFTVVQSTSSALSGPWAAPVLYWDENLKPPLPLPLLQGLAPVYSKILASGTIGVTVGLVLTSPGFFRGVLFTWGPGSAPPITAAQIAVVQSITGGSGTPTTVTATGPTPTSGTGGFTATPVGIGTYTITQIPVAGFTAGTPVLSGSGGTLIGNVLTVANGDNVTVTIPNTFNSGDLAGACNASKIVLGVFYDRVIPVSGGVPPYHFTVHSGTLPTGLTLDPDTGEISGIPTDVGTPYVIQVEDSA